MAGSSVPRAALLIAANDFRLTLRARGVLVWIFAMPLVFMLAFGLTFRGSAASGGKARLTLENKDGGSLSKALVAELRAERLEIVDSLGAGEKPVRTLVIPADFTERVLRRERIRLVLRKESDANVEASEAVNAAVYRGLVRVVSNVIEVEAGALERGTEGFAFAGDSLSGSLFAAAGLDPGLLPRIETELDSLRAVPSLVTVRSSVAGKIRKVPSGFQGSVPGNLVMFVLMTMVFSGSVISVERASGVLRRYAYTPCGKGTVLLGKLLGRMGIAFVQILFLLLAGKYAFHVSLGSSPGGLILLMALFAFCTGAFGIFFGSLIRDPEHVSALSVITTLTMAALGGCWWPIELAPRAFKIVSLCLPTGWAMDGIHKLISFGYGAGAIAPHVAMLAGFGLLFILLASWRLAWSKV